jgi:hypothetical protein
MMKQWRIIAGALALIAGTTRGSAQASGRTLEQDLTLLEMQSWNAWKSRDSTFFKQFLSDDHVEIQPAGVANKTAVVASVGTPNCIVKGYSVGSFKLTVFNETTALLTYRAAQDTQCNGVAVPSPVWTGSLYIKRDGRWQNAAYQHTKATETPPKPAQ